MTASLAASPWKDANADVSSQLTVPMPRAALVERLDDTRELAALFPERCMLEWEHGVAPAGPARVTYQIKSFHRRLTARIVAVEPKRVEIDHEGNRGFITRFLLTEVEGGTEVTLTTFLNGPGWPLRSYFFEAVRPEWESCYVEALQRLAAAP